MAVMKQFGVRDGEDGGLPPSLQTEVCWTASNGAGYDFGPGWFKATEIPANVAGSGKLVAATR
jgi:hypothetical protein